MTDSSFERFLYKLSNTFCTFHYLKDYKLYTLAQRVRLKQALTHILLVLFKIVKVFQTVGAKKEIDR